MGYSFQGALRFLLSTESCCACWNDCELMLAWLLLWDDAIVVNANFDFVANADCVVGSMHWVVQRRRTIEVPRDLFMRDGVVNPRSWAFVMLMKIDFVI